MIVECSFSSAPSQGESWSERWGGPDKGLICSWLRGIEKAKESPELAGQASRGELPSLPWVGGGKAIKAGKRVGALHYLAMWQGLRGDDLNIDLVAGATRTCTLTGMAVTFTGDASAIWKAAGEPGGIE
ncbi:hypothetical protein QFZ42_002899 [Variovorax paradoxus]|uniref:hypothetical protein n=1 Tax=Variovorax paradoxus TaxID=34073 RepID=UPI00278DE809|nr:hypothetical protein [Variovorax paradoxus]MDQ0571065.1 hypothetical protein [Variovorax paradoxus]